MNIKGRQVQLRGLAETHLASLISFAAFFFFFYIFRYCDACLIRSHSIKIPQLSSWEVAHWVSIDTRNIPRPDAQMARRPDD